MSKSLKILLICPPFRTPVKSPIVQPPLGLLYLGTVLKKEGYQVKILDAGVGTITKIDENSYYCGMQDSEIEKVIQDEAPDLVGMGCLFTEKWNHIVRIAAMVKKYNKNCITVGGGFYPSMCPEESLGASKDIDYCFIGEAEDTFLNFVNLINDNQKKIDERNIEKILAIEGLIYRKNGIIKKNLKKKFIEDLDALPFPDYDLLIGGLEPYFNYNSLWLGKRYLSVVTSRACPNKCSFCNIDMAHGSKFRYRSAESMIGELKYLSEKYGIKKFSYADDNVSLNIPRFKKFNQMLIDMGSPYEFSATNGLMVVTLNEEVIGLMGKSGWRFVSLAIESADENIRSNVIGKSIKDEKIYNVCKWFRKTGIIVNTFFIVGFFEDNEETVRKNVAMIRKIKAHTVTVSTLQLYPGTALYQSYVAKGLMKDENKDRFSLDERNVSTAAELYQGYRQNAARWAKAMNMAYIASLLTHPWDLIRFSRFYFHIENIARGLNYFKRVFGVQA